jgi:alpha-galactosidase
VDFLKVDCIADHPYKASEIRQIAKAITRSGRDVVLSLSPGPTSLDHHEEVAELAQMWRISNDIWDVWNTGKGGWPIGIKDQFENAARWAQYSRPGNWPDADMLPVGELSPFPDVGPKGRHTTLTPDEQHTQLSLWAMARSPLIAGANLTRLDADTERLLTNPDILAVDQAATSSRQVLRDGDLVIWTADLPRSVHAVAVFNLGDQPITVDRELHTLGLPDGSHGLRNAWTGTRLSPSSRVTATLDPHASAVFMLDRQ